MRRKHRGGVGSPAPTCNHSYSVTPIESVSRQPNSAIMSIDSSAFEPGIFLPTKLIEYMMSGRPILALSVHGPVWDLIAKYNAGIAVRFDDVDEITRALEMLYLKRDASSAGNFRNLREFEA